jgi:metal-responsive CopG/Arc/MetJ family transcriptional regulator
MPRNEIETKTHRFVLPLTQTMYSEVEKRAGDLKISQSEFIRRAIEKEIHHYESIRF